MELSDRQKHRIERYLEETRACLQDLAPEQARQALGQLQSRILRELGQFEGDRVSDADIEQVLDTCGAPAEQAERILGARLSDGYGFLGWHQRTWLGVCAGLARQMDADPRTVRTLAVLLGLLPFLTPFLLLGYIAAFLSVYGSGNGYRLPKVRWTGVAASAGSTLFLVIVVYAVSRFLPWGIGFIYESLAGAPLEMASRWRWLESYDGPMFVWALLVGLPLSAISAMPVPPAWGKTLGKVVAAGLCLYALIVCFGIALVAAGAVTEAARQVTGGGFDVQNLLEVL